ncbi:hypothetical protein V8V75_24565 [Peribacillus frigoritolerans]|uniref:hypothetical protein n=1 Tax=Peribacillus frigoritolerans TaxID=450367 RepID=UPI003009E96F
MDINDIISWLAETAKKTEGVISTALYESYKLSTVNGDDYAPVIQQAVNDAKSKGLTNVIVPYKDTGYIIASKVSVPKGIYLLGQGNSKSAYLSGGVKGTGIFSKTYFIMDYYNGTHGAFDIKDTSGMSNFGFYYKTVDTNITSGDVPTFPFTITSSGFGYELKNLSVVGASHFISADNFERGTIQGIYGLITKVAFRLKKSRDISRIVDIHLNPNSVYPAKEGKVSEGFSTYFISLLKRDLTVFKLGGADYYYFENILTYASNKFLHVVANNLDDGLGNSFDSYPFTMMGNNILADNTIYGLYIERPISFTSKLTNLSIVPIADDGTAKGIVMSGEASGLISITNFDSKGTPGKTDKHIVIDSTGVSTIDVQSGRFIYPGGDSLRTDFSNMFTVTGDNQLHVEVVFSKTTTNGKYRKVHYSSTPDEYPNGLKLGEFKITQSPSKLTFSHTDGSDTVDRVPLDIDNANKKVQIGSVDGYGVGISNATITSDFVVASTIGATGKVNTLGTGALVMVRSAQNGGFAIFAYDSATGFTQVINTGSIFVTASPTGSQVKLEASGGGVKFTTATGKQNIVVSIFSIFGAS